MAKPVSINMLKEEVSMYDEFIEIPVGNSDSEYTLKLYPYFKPEKVRDLVKEMSEFFKLCKKEKVEINSDEEDDIVCFFVVKHFTNITFTKSKKAKKIYDEFKILINSSLYPIIMKTIPEESIKKVYEYAHEVINASVRVEEMFEKAQKQISELPLENRELLEKIANHNSVRNVLVDPIN